MRSSARMPGSSCSATSDRNGKVAVRLAPGDTYRLVRRIIPGANLFDVRGVADRSGGKGRASCPPCGERHGGPSGPRGRSRARREGKPHAWGRTDHAGNLLLTTGEAPGSLTVSAPGRGSKEVALARDAPASLSVELPEAGAVVGRITDERGSRSPARCSSSGGTGPRAPTSARTAASMPSRTCTTATTAASAASWRPAPTT